MLTCPRCSELCPPQSVYCCECGCALLLTASERRLLDLHKLQGDRMAAEWGQFIDSLPDAR